MIDAGVVGRRGDLALHRVAFEPLRLVAELARGFRILAQVGDLVGRRRDAESTPVCSRCRVDSVPLERREVAVVVLEPQLLDGADLVGKVMQPVVEAVRERGIGEAAVSSRRALGHGIGLEEHDVAVRIRFLGVDRGPEPGEAAAHDQQVGALVSRQGEGAARGDPADRARSTWARVV